LWKQSLRISYSHAIEKENLQTKNPKDAYNIINKEQLYVKREKET
jgi:hypothetical protein